MNTVIAFAITVFFSCTKKTSQDNLNLILANAPDAIGKDIHLQYTDSGRLTAVMNTPLIHSFTNREFAYREFPEGVILDLFDKEGKKTIVKADYGISYVNTNIIDLRGNVDIKTGDSIHLTAPQLYWDQDHSWVFTDHPYKVIRPDGSFNNGDGFDANQDFTNFNSRSNIGVQLIAE